MRGHYTVEWDKRAILKMTDIIHVTISMNRVQSEQEEQRRLDAMIAEAERYRKIGEAVDMFESFQRFA